MPHGGQSNGYARRLNGHAFQYTMLAPLDRGRAGIDASAGPSRGLVHPRCERVLPVQIGEELNEPARSLVTHDDAIETPPNPLAPGADWSDQLCVGEDLLPDLRQCPSARGFVIAPGWDVPAHRIGHPPARYGS